MTAGPGGRGAHRGSGAPWGRRASARSRGLRDAGEPERSASPRALVRRLLPAVLATFVGLLMAVQSRINGTLAVRLDSGIEAAVVSFGTGLVLLCAVVAARPSLRAAVSRIAAQVRGGDLRWWQCLGGVGGGYFVAVQSATVPLIGVAVFTVAVVGGQTANSLLVDRAGLGPAGRRPITGLRVIAATLAIVAVAISVSDRFAGGAAGEWLPLVLAVSAGVGIAAQQAINGRVAIAARAPVAAAWLNFVTGTTALLVAAAVGWVAGVVRMTPLPAGPLWLYLGGPIGVVFIAVAAAVVRPLGVLLFALLSITGQLAGAAVLDRIAPAPGVAAGAHLYLGMALTAVAVAVAGVRTRST